MNKKIFVASMAAGVLLISCAQRNPHPMDMTQAVQDAKTPADHAALAEHYDEAAREMQGKVDEHKKLLGQYEAKSYLYGKQAQTLKAHCQALIHAYEQAAESNRQLAADHRQMTKP